jgi:ABC-2 type transport system ATP-binding protein
MRISISAEVTGSPNGLAKLPDVHNLLVDGSRVRFAVDADALNRALRELTDADVRSLSSQPPTLEELFLRHYQARQPDVVG